MIANPKFHIKKFWHNKIQATGITASKKLEVIRPPTHATSSDCFAVRAHKLAAAIMDDEVNNQLVQDSGKIRYILRFFLQRRVSNDERQKS